MSRSSSHQLGRRNRSYRSFDQSRLRYNTSEPSKPITQVALCPHSRFFQKNQYLSNDANVTIWFAGFTLIYILITWREGKESRPTTMAEDLFSKYKAKVTDLKPQMLAGSLVTLVREKESVTSLRSGRCAACRHLVFHQLKAFSVKLQLKEMFR